MRNNRLLEYPRKKGFICFILALFLVFMIPTSFAQAASLKLKTTKKVLLMGETYVIKTNTKKRVSWSSSNGPVAGVCSNGKVVAKKPGKAIITATCGKKSASCVVHVKQNVDIIVFAGQSNMTGNGSAYHAPKLKDGAGYSYNAVSKKKAFEPLKEPFGRGQDNAYFQNGTYANGSMVTAFVNSYYQQTKTPVIAVSASSVGTGSVSWATERYKGVIERTNAAVKLAKEKGLIVDHIFMVWMQGENDAFAQMSGDNHKKNVSTMYSNIKKKTKMNACFLITIPSYFAGSLAWSPKGPVDLEFDITAAYKNIQQAQLALCKSSKNFYLVSTKASELDATYIQRDGIHISQSGLNLIGKDAGKNAGNIAKKMK